jgi:hypothetical protein
MSISVVVRWRLEVYYAHFFLPPSNPPPSDVAWGVLSAAVCSLRPSKWPREPIVPIFYFGLLFFHFLLENLFFSTAELVRVYETPPPLLPKIIIIQDDIKEEPPQQCGT